MWVQLQVPLSGPARVRVPMQVAESVSVGRVPAGAVWAPGPVMKLAEPQVRGAPVRVLRRVGAQVPATMLQVRSPVAVRALLVWAG